MIAELTARLAELAALNQTTTYGALARDLGLTGPATIARVTDALETLMEQDTAANLPLRAALVNARNSTLPAPGFFAKAADLGQFINGTPGDFIARQRASLYLEKPDR
jgi:hypothetical protein